MTAARRRRLAYAVGSAAAGLAAALGAVTGLTGLALLLPPAAVWVGALVLRLLLGGCHVTHDGIWCCHGLLGLDLVPWDQVSGLREVAGAWWVETPFGNYRAAVLPTRWLVWSVPPAQAVALVRQAHNEQTIGADAVTAPQVAAWLGIAEDGELVGQRRNGGLQELLTAFGVGAVVFCLARQYDTALSWLMVGVLVITARAYWRPWSWFRADVGGLTVCDRSGRRRRLAWRDVALASRIGDTWVLRTARGTLHLPADMVHLDRLDAAVRQLVAARAAGAVLPRLTDAAPAAALSRAEVAAGPERGLSRLDAGST